MRNKGFTLIELLIVVAIIAILAAIAVPNFLEAQVRSKVARAKSDMRTLATAVESYMIDHNAPPYGYAQSKNDVLPTAVSADNVGLRWSFWTTPIAYITSIPQDPFVSQGRIIGGTPQTWDKYYLYNSSKNRRIDGQPVWNTGNQAKAEYNLDAMKKNVTWLLWSWGPSRRNAIGGKSANIWGAVGHVNYTTTLSFPDLFYDPTNGTTSFGWIVRSSNGFEPAG